MSQIENLEPILITAGGKITCRRCKARSSRTKMQCAKPALKGKAVCGHHGGYSTGPKTKEGKECIRFAHWKDGSETKEAKAERSEKNLLLRYLTDLGNHCNLFYKQLKTRGRPPSEYVKPDLTDPKQLALVLQKILASK